jgi:peptide/nickel transport system ATP-binding protein
LDVVSSRKKSILNDISFTVARGKTVGIVGESGSGKSMLCRSLLGVLPPGLSIGRGSMQFDGIDITALSFAEWRRFRGRRLTAIFQDPASHLNPSIPVGSQVAEIFRVHKRLSRQHAQRETLALFEQVNLIDPHRVYNHYSFELSGGMLQRIAIAAAVALEPELLIADEATSALDVTVQAEIIDILLDLKARLNLALMFVSHDLAVVAQISDHVIVMYEGRIVEQGEPSRILTAPEHPFTKSLLQSHHRFSIENIAPERFRHG